MNTQLLQQQGSPSGLLGLSHLLLLALQGPMMMLMEAAIVTPLRMQGDFPRPACLFNLYAEFIMQKARLDKAQAGIKIAGRNINNLRYADDTTLMAESEGKLKSLLIKVKEESKKVCLKLNIQKTKIMASGPITSWQVDG